MVILRRIALAAALGLLTIFVSSARGTAGDATCTLTPDASTPGYIDESYANLKTYSSPYYYYYAILYNPDGSQQAAVFRADVASYTVIFPEAGSGTYMGALILSVDNQKGSAKFTTLPVSCTAAVP